MCVLVAQENGTQTAPVLLDPLDLCDLGALSHLVAKSLPPMRVGVHWSARFK